MQKLLKNNIIRKKLDNSRYNVDVTKSITLEITEKLYLTKI